MVERGETFKSVSVGAGVSTSTLTKIAKNKTIQTDVLKKVCNYLKCDLSDLLTMKYQEESGD